MPITLASVSRRRFLAGSIGFGAGLWLSRYGFGLAEGSDPHRLALLSDVHIDADLAARDRGVVMYDHLKQVRGEVLALSPKPAAVFINGDCAHLRGRSEDYGTLVELLQPLRKNGLPIHLTMGNHDNREHLWSSIPGAEEHVKPLPARQNMVLDFPRARFFLLDSLQQTNVTPGVLGAEQLHWLASALDDQRDKPAIVMVHHQPDDRPKPDGLIDTQALLDVLLPRKHVKALIYGHTHHWDVTHRGGIHCINLPAVAYVFHPADPSGWVDCNLREDGMNLQLRCVDPMHPAHGQRVELTWRG